MNYMTFLKLCDRMQFEVNCVKLHHHIKLWNTQPLGLKTYIFRE